MTDVVTHTKQFCLAGSPHDQYRFEMFLGSRRITRDGYERG
jgi:hypothetical protein